MKQNRKIQACLAVLLAAAPLASQATVFFTDNFASGSTTNGPSVPGGTSTASSTSYDIASTKNAAASTISPGVLTLKLNSATTSGWVESQALFASTPVTLTAINDYIEMTVVFTNTAGTLLAGGSASLLYLGLYNSGGSAPLAGNLVSAGLSTASGSAYATGNCANWQGYACQIATNGTCRIYTRPVQNGAGTTSANQDLVGNGGNSGAFNNPVGAILVTGPNTSISITAPTTYTLLLNITLIDANTLSISNSLFSGTGTGGTLLYSQAAANVIGANFLTATFDGFAIGAFNKGTSFNPVMDVTSIQINGTSTPVSAPPDITTQPMPVTVANGGSCIYSVVASGFGMTYQWHRFGTNLANGGNISGATSDTLIISPASAADVASGANGYYVTITGTGHYSTNSSTNSLTLGTASSLVWSGSGTDWDLNNSANWLNGVNPAVFNYGDAVTFDNTGVGNLSVTMTGKYLSASSVTVNTDPGYDYVFSGTGSFAGAGSLIYQGAGLLTLNNANTHTGGTIISNSSAYLVLRNYGALGSGPVTLAKAGGTMEVVPTGGASTGINGDIVVQDDFTIRFDGKGSYAGVMLGNLSGLAGKTLTLTQPDLTTTNRYRVYGTNTTFDSDLVLDGNASAYAAADGTVLAPYNASGSQTYNGVISGNGGIIQRSGGTTILKGQNTYSGGTVPTTGTIGLGVNSTPTSGTVTSGPIGTGALLIAPELPGTTGSGAILAFGGARTIANPLQYPSATNNQTLIIGGTNALTFTGPCTLDGNDSTGTQTNRILQVNNTALTTISGVISGTGFGLIKTGNGILDITAANTYTGPTMISNGTLRVNGSISSSGVTVATNGTLGGSGAISGPVTVLAGGTIAPGNSIGTLAFNGGLTVSGNLNIEVNRLGLSSDMLTVSGILTNAGAGTVTVTNLGAALVAGDSFALFNKALANGNLLTVAGGQAVWTNRLAVDGTIAVLTPISTAPTEIGYTLSANTLTLSWPLDHLTWTLQSNSVSVASSSHWFPIAGTASATQYVTFVDTAITNVFYRLVAP